MRALLSLSDAAAMLPSALTVSSLRKERDRGNLRTYLIAGKEFTTVDDVEQMVKRCAVMRRDHDSGSAKIAATPAATSPTEPSGSSATDSARLARDAALQTAKALKQRSRRTSRPSTAPRAASETLAPSRSPTSSLSSSKSEARPRLALVSSEAV